MVSNALKEYLQVDLLQTHVITAIRTQGRFGKGQGQEYTEAYVLEYWRPGFDKWQRWKNTQGKEVSEVTSINPKDILSATLDSADHRFCLGTSTLTVRWRMHCNRLYLPQRYAYIRMVNTIAPSAFEPRSSVAPGKVSAHPLLSST